MFAASRATFDHSRLLTPFVREQIPDWSKRSAVPVGTRHSLYVTLRASISVCMADLGSAASSGGASACGKGEEKKPSIQTKYDNNHIRVKCVAAA